MGGAEILHDGLSHAPWQRPETARYPGMVPVAPGDWLTVDARYAAQMAERARLLRTARAAVLNSLPGAEAGVAELYATVLAAIGAHPRFAVREEFVRCPDGRGVRLDPADPLGTLGHLVQEDLCLMQKPEGGAEHVLTAAVLCFPASWTLAEKIGRPLSEIHAPVPQYGPGLALRVQRLFDGLRAPEAGGQVLLRMNALEYSAPALFQPRRGRAPGVQEPGEYLRVERQCLRKLPRSGAVAFSIHTTVVPMAALSEAERAAYAAYAADHRLTGV